MRARRIWELLLIVTVSAGAAGCEQLEEIIRSISDGASCGSDGQCLGGACIRQFPDGYCTTLSCDTLGCSNIFGAECLVLNDVQSGPACYAACDFDEDCRVDYRCVDLDGARVCLPNELVEGLPQAGETGTSCARDSDCVGGTCLNNYTGGYCTALSCTSDSECAAFGDGRCLSLADSAVTACLDGCQTDDECRFGYGCTDPDGGGGVCDVLDEGDPVRNPNGVLDGEPCLVDINCRGGTCLRTEEGYPGGYCTTLNCTRVGCNGANTTCKGLENDTACFLTCSDNAQCREGYECVPAGYCAPPINTRPPSDPTGSLDIICESEPITGGRRFSFNIDATTTSFSVVPLSETEAVRPTLLRLPDGTIGADFQGGYAFHDLNWQLLVNITPTFFPAAPSWASITQQGGGLYSLDVATSANSTPCYYLLEKADEGATIALNIYLIGVPGVSAASAASNANLQQMVDGFEAIYNNAGISLASVRYYDPTQDTLNRFSIIRDLNEVFELLATSQNPGPTLGDQLSVNVFLIQDFAIPQAPGLLGLSSGLPGVPGLHGNHGSGLVFTSAPLGADNAALGQTLAHEVGHYNGLRHTTEHDSTHDPLADTPECGNPNDGAACPDATNFMFPFSLGGVRQTIVSSEQAQVLRWAPLVR